MRQIQQFVIFLLLSSIAAAACSQEGELSKADICSLFQVAVLNGKSLTKGDVLVRELFSFDSVSGLKGLDDSGIAVNSRELHRIVFDFETNRFAILKARKLSILDLSEVDGDGNEFQAGNDGPVETESLYGACYNSGSNRVCRRWFPNSMQVQEREASAKKLDSLLSEIEFQDYRFAFNNTRGDPGQLKAIEETYKRYETGDQLVGFTTPDKNLIEVEIGSPTTIVDAPEGHEFKGASVVTQFDRAISLPIERRYVFRFTSPQGNTVEFNPRGSTKIGWEKIGNIYVVKSISTKGIESFGANGRMHDAEATRKIDLHWFSVNEDLGDDWFDGKLLADEREVLKRLDPVAAGADSLKK